MVFQFVGKTKNNVVEVGSNMPTIIRAEAIARKWEFTGNSMKKDGLVFWEFHKERFLAWDRIMQCYVSIEKGVML